MFLIDQDIANQIAKTQKLSNAKCKKLFSATEEEVEKLEQIERERVAKVAGDNVARAWIMYYPLLFEHIAITKFINQNSSYDLRLMIPEIFTPDQAALCAQGNNKLTDEETLMLKSLFEEEKRGLETLRKELEDNQKLNMLPAFTSKYPEWINPHLMTLTFCQNTNVAYLEMSFSEAPYEVSLDLDFISGPEESECELLFNPDDDVVDNARTFLELDSYSLINCVQHLFTREAEEIIADNFQKEINISSGTQSL